MTESQNRIGDFLVQQQIITAAQLDAALTQQVKLGGKLGKSLVTLGYLTEIEFLQALAAYHKLPLIDLKYFEFKPKLIKLLPENLARRHHAIVLDETSHGLFIGMADPMDMYAYDELARVLKRPLELALVNEADLVSCIDTTYRQTEQINTFAKALSDELSTAELAHLTANQLSHTQDPTDAPVVKLLQTLFEDAVRSRASDIHIEPGETVLRIRLRVDGILQEQLVENTTIAAAVAQRLKLVAKLNIAEKRLPQDGRFNIKVQDRILDVRLSTLPTQYGESVVLRLLDQSTLTPDLVKLGIPDVMVTTLKQLIQQPHGMLLVTGPTGSGKTTTLYSLLHELNSSERKIITVEDPVEYRLPRINQVQVNPQIHLTFGKVLNSSLRQDPDVIMVGEIRDLETASIALRAAMTGHLVLATLHTNDAASSAIRLMDIGVEGYLVGTALRAILAQRLVRKICERCKTEHALSAAEKNLLNSVFGDTHTATQFHIGQGCSFCNHTGYRGRQGIYALLVLNFAMMDALRKNSPAEFSRVVTKTSGNISLETAALKAAIAGITTLAEVMRVIGSL